MTYDAAGNQTAITTPARSFVYDAENRQTQATINSTVTSYVYDGDGRRVKKTVGSTVTTFVYDAQGNLAVAYGGPAIPVTGTTYLTGDHLGSTRLVTNPSGTALQRFDYAPFGEELTAGIDSRPAPYSTNQYPTATLDGTPHKFTSKERDAETGLDFFGARYFSAAQGRWTIPDWSAKSEPVPYAKLDNPQSLNLYGYVLNNPLSHLDLDGHIDCSGSNSQGSGCQAISQWNAQHDVLSARSKTAIAKSPLTVEQKVAFSNAVVRSAGNNQVDPNLIVGLGYKESGINPTLENGEARGIFQIRPGMQDYLKLTDEQVVSVTGAVPAVAGYFGRYITLFNSRSEDKFGQPLAIASWTMGVQGTINVFKKSGMDGVRNVDLGDRDHHHVGPDYIDAVKSFE